MAFSGAISPVVVYEILQKEAKENELPPANPPFAWLAHGPCTVSIEYAMARIPNEESFVALYGISASISVGIHLHSTTQGDIGRP